LTSRGEGAESGCLEKGGGGGGEGKKTRYKRRDLLITNGEVLFSKELLRTDTRSAEKKKVQKRPERSR